MAKKKISVNGEKELIEKLNSKIKTIKSDEKPETAATPDIKEPDTEPETVSTGENVTVSDKNEPDWKRWDKIESGLQRRLKFDTYKDKGYADACIKPRESLVEYFNNEWNKDEKDIKRLIDKIGSNMANLLDRVEHVNHIDDNTSSRNTINKEIGIPAFDEIGYLIPDKPVTEEFKKVLDASKKTSDEIKNIKNSSNKKTMSNDVESVINDILAPKKDLITDTYEMVDHPQHYNNYEYEVIDMMRKIYGDEKTAIFCELNAFKYRMRMGTKPTSPIQEDLKKEQWYLKKKQEILNN